VQHSTKSAKKATTSNEHGGILLGLQLGRLDLTHGGVARTVQLDTKSVQMELHLRVVGIHTVKSGMGRDLDILRTRSMGEGNSMDRGALWIGGACCNYTTQRKGRVGTAFLVIRCTAYYYILLRVYIGLRSHSYSIKSSNSKNMSNTQVARTCPTCPALHCIKAAKG
jgi:hypothetical protein